MNFLSKIGIIGGGASGIEINRRPFDYHTIENFIKISPHGFGFLNQGAPNFWFVGHSSKYLIWEITAIPDIRKQIKRILEEIKL